MRDKEMARQRRHARIRKSVVGTSERPRLSVFRSARHFYAQVIDDSTGRTLAAASTLKLEGAKSSGNVDAARKVGTLLAKRAGEQGVTKVVMDRGGFSFHGRVKAFADAAREAGLSF